MNTYINWKLRNDWEHIPSDMEKDVEAALMKSLKSDRVGTLVLACLYTLISAALIAALVVIVACADRVDSITLETFMILFFLCLTSVFWGKHKEVSRALKALKGGNYKVIQTSSEESRWNSATNAFQVHDEERKLLAHLSFKGKAAKAVENRTHCPVVLVRFPNETFRMVAKTDEGYEVQGSSYIHFSFDVK